MNENYKKLMAQHGGYIPFTVLGGTKTPSKTNSSKRLNSRTKAKAKKAKKANKTVRSKSTFMTNAGKYAPGTIIRSNGILYHLDNSRQWLRV
jgi:DeoR/GlpR family transcriptional regulator of sugar metabolism